MWAQIVHHIPGMLNGQGMLLLQAAAIIGIVSSLLLLRRSQRYPALARLGYGWVLGIAGFLLTWLVMEDAQGPLKPYLRNDLLFTAAMLGGWRAGLQCLGLMFLARVMFSPLGDPHFAAVDMSLVTLGGVATHYWLRTRPVVNWGLAELTMTWLCRMASSLLAISVVAMANPERQDFYAMIISLRISGAGTSLLILAAIMALVRYEAMEKEAATKQLRQARTDQLTGLPNRRALREHIDSLLVGVKAATAPVHTLVLIEAQNLRELLQVHGHDWSTQFWRDLAEFLGRPPVSELLDRYDPEVFLFSDQTLAIVLHRAPVAEVRGRNLIAELHLWLSEWLRGNARSPLPRLHYGVAETGEDNINTDQLLRHLALSLHMDDQIVHFYRPALAERAELEERIREMLSRWIDAEQPVPLHYQPKFDLRSLQVASAEALLRARDDDGHAISPAAVLDVAERYQLTVDFEWATIRTAIDELVHCGRRGRRLQLAVNISAMSLTTPEFGRRVAQQLQDRGVDGNLLTLEVTETMRLPDEKSVRQNVLALRAADVKLALDDFGTGHSALTLLARLPFGEIKIDHYMVTRLDDPRMREAVSLAQEIAQRYDATLVAEGVETEIQRQALLDMGIRLGQGYLFSAAVPLDEVLAIMAARGATGDQPLPLTRAGPQRS